MGPVRRRCGVLPAITDFVYQVEGASHLFITGPDVIKAVTGEDVTFDTLGGADPHSTASGVTHFVAADGRQALEEVRFLLSFLPQNNQEAPPFFTPTDRPDRMEEGLTTIVPDSPNQPYDMVDLIELVVDDGEFYEVHHRFAPNLVVGFARLDGYSVGIVGNNPAALAGTLDIDASVKGARFVRFCDAFNIPIVSFVDVPGFPPWRRPGARRDHPSRCQVALTHTAKQPCLATVITRKAYGGAYVVKNSRGSWCRHGLCMADREIAVMGAQGAVNIIHRREITEAGDPGGDAITVDRRLRADILQPIRRSRTRLIDEVIEPRRPGSG